MSFKKVQIFKARGFTLTVLWLLLCLCVSRVRSQDGTPITLPQSDIDAILRAHNFLRGNVDPPASNMQALVSNSIIQCSIISRVSLYISYSYATDVDH